ncbi:MAG: DUF5009 domain-containing protein [Kiritimatiellae bacterium]|nr:DUF5009 domain-containing protein [Kiritimatiellia bacterium]
MTKESTFDVKPTGGRLASLDALRGFDMFFITGGAGIITGLCRVLGHGDGWLARQMSHVPWAGLAFLDTVFPLFLFLAGVSWPFSLAAQRNRGLSSTMIHLRVFKRALLLFFLGMTLGGVLGFTAGFRIPSVLGQIGISWGVAAILYMHVRKPLFRGLIVAAILVGYWLLLAFTGAPNAPAGADLYAKEWNIVSWLDRTIMPNYIYVKGVYDPESLFSIPPGIALAMLGMSAGSVLVSPRGSGVRKTLVLLCASGVMLAAGLFFIFVLGMPVVKALWTSSFVLVTAAYSFAMLAGFYWIVDVKGWSRWAFYFKVIGMNSIAIYMLTNIGVIAKLKDFCLGGLVSKTAEPWCRLADSLALQAACWVVLYVFYRRKVFFKV